jgi:alcohol dehydrogenase class IV
MSAGARRPRLDRTAVGPTLGFYTAPRIALGPGAIQQLSALESSRTLVVIDPAVAPTPTAQRAIEELRKMEGTVEAVTIPPGEPTVGSVAEVGRGVRGSAPEWIVGIGGGSAIDTAKALWVRASHPDLPWEAITPLTALALRARTRFAAVPTTVGSGSEASWVAHLHGDDGGFLEVASRELVPDWSIVDPAFVGSLPTKVAAETAIDAIAHALEAAASEWANPFSDAHARAALAVLIPGLARVGRKSEEDLRGTLLYASTQAGIAASNAQAGLTHALAHAVSTEFRIPHARLVAALLPYVLEFNFPSGRERYAALGPTIGLPLVQNRYALSGALRSSADATGLPRTLPDAGVPTDQLEPALERIVARALRLPGVASNPRVPSASEAARLLRAAASGASVDF